MQKTTTPSESQSGTRMFTNSKSRRSLCFIPAVSTAASPVWPRDLVIRTATQEPEHGLTQDVLDATDVLLGGDTRRTTR